MLLVVSEILLSKIFRYRAMTEPTMAAKLATLIYMIEEAWICFCIM